MKKINLSKNLCLLAVMTLLGTVGTQAQDLKSILSGVVKEVVGDKATTESSIVGTWAYSAPDCQFKSENLLSKAGGAVAAQKVEEQLKTVYDKIGMSGCQYVFNADSTYTIKVKSRTLSGTYTFDSEAKTITMKPKLGIKMTANVAVTGSTMSLTFNADKLMSFLKTLLGSVSKLNSSASTISTLAENYDGLLLGFELTKQ